MQRTRILGSALLALGLAVGGAPQAVATDNSPLAPQANWGNCATLLGDAGSIPTARCAMVPVDGQTSIAVIRIPAEGTRIEPLCTGCALCVPACPVDCIVLVPAMESAA